MKKLGKFLLLSTFSLMTVACGGNDQSTSTLSNSEVSSQTSTSEIQEEVTITFWHGFTGADGDSMETIINDFNKEFKGKVQVKKEVYLWDTLFTKLFTTTTNPRFMPHIVAMSANRLAGVKARKLLTPMNDIMDKFSLSESDFLPAAYNAGIIDGERYSFPLDTHPTAIYYNTELIEESELPTTWDEFIAVCKEKTKNGVYGWAIPNQYSITKDIYYSMLLQEGSEILTSDNKSQIYSQKGVEVLSKLENWKYTDKISPASVGDGGDYSLFKAGKSVFYFDGPWTINSMKADDGLNFKFGTIPMPGSTGDNGVSFAGSHQLTLIDKTVTNDAIRNACYTFINYLTEHGIEWAKAGQVPARLSCHSSEEFKALKILAPFVEEAKKVKLGNVNYQYMYEAYNYMGSAVAEALNTAEFDADEKLNTKDKTFKRFLAEEE